MQEEAGPEWDHIDQPTLEEVEKSWAHSRCREVEFNISSTFEIYTFVVSVSLLLAAMWCVRACMCVTLHLTILLFACWWVGV